MSLSRFKMIMKFLRFDDTQDRAERRQRDRLAAFRDVWELFMQKCRTCYSPSPECTVDEQLVGFRGRYIFRVYMPKKPDRYGLKIWWLQMLQRAMHSMLRYTLEDKVICQKLDLRRG